VHRQAVNMHRHGNLIAWTRESGLFVRVDRATPWAGPFVLGPDGDRATVIARCRDALAPWRDLVVRPGELSRKVLGCWCAPAACYARKLPQVQEETAEVQRQGPPNCWVDSA
jgi:hypothetical protein